MADPKQPRAAAEQTMRVDTALVRELAELLSANELNEIEVEDGGRRIKVRRDSAPAAGFVPAATAAPAPAASAAVAAPPAAEPTAPVDAIKSPMVGTAYLAPEPGAKPFISPGQAVKQGDTLLVIEAMKVMNPITAPKAGTVRQLLIGDAQPVEFDQPLVVID
jgi:acetyl-CoA carboxylase biotin carboxyl carrier protein